MRSPYKSLPTDCIAARIEELAAEKENWERRIQENCTQEHNPIFRPRKEYERRIKKCEERIAKYSAELERRNKEAA
jgi:hypothetical protein